MHTSEKEKRKKQHFKEFPYEATRTKQKKTEGNDRTNKEMLNLYSTKE